jgi:hypothetical protein
MTIAVLESVEKSEKGLQELEQDALRLRAEKLSAAGSATLRKIQARVAELRKTIKSIQALAPHEAGQRVVIEMQAAEGGACSGTDLNKLFGLTAAVLHRRRKERRIICWRDARHDFFYPRWQFTDSGALLPGVREVLQIFNSDDEWRVMRYFLGVRKQLGNRRPLDLLRAEETEKVIAHAGHHGAENTW